MLSSLAPVPILVGTSDAPTKVLAVIISVDEWLHFKMTSPTPERKKITCDTVCSLLMKHRRVVAKAILHVNFRLLKL